MIILDLDLETLDDIMRYALRWRDVKILLLAGSADLKNDFRSWVAHDYVCKGERDDVIVEHIDRLLTSTN